MRSGVSLKVRLEAAGGLWGAEGVDFERDWRESGWSRDGRGFEVEVQGYFCVGRGVLIDVWRVVTSSLTKAQKYDDKVSSRPARQRVIIWARGICPARMEIEY